MAVAHVQNPTAYARSSSASSVNLSYPSTPSVGNRSCVVAHQWSSGTKGVNVPTDNQGNTYTEHVEASDGGNQRTAQSSAEIVTASGTFTVTQGFASTSWCAVMILEKSGVDHSNPTVATNSNTGTSTSASSGAVTPASADDLCLAAVSHDGSTMSITPGSGFTQRIENESASDGQPSNIAEKQDTGSQTCTWTLGSSATWIAAIVVYRASTGGTTPVGKSQEAQWHVRALVNKDQAAEWHVRAAVAKAQAADWNVLEIVGKSQEAQWHVLTVVGKDQEAQWHVRTAIAEDQEAAWNLAAAVGTEMTASWHVESFIAAETVYLITLVRSGV